MDEPEPWQPKLWGRTRRLSEYPTGHACLAEAIAGGHSSRHCHPTRSNAFFVLHGELLVEEWDSDPPVGFPPVTRRLLADDALVVPAGVWHRFIAVTPLAVIETYQTTRSPSDGTDPSPDIVRYDEGGVGSPSYGEVV